MAANSTETQFRHAMQESFLADTFYIICIGILIGFSCGASALLFRRALLIRHLRSGKAYAAISTDTSVETPPVDTDASVVQPS